MISGVVALTLALPTVLALYEVVVDEVDYEYLVCNAQRDGFKLDSNVLKADVQACEAEQCFHWCRFQKSAQAECKYEYCDELRLEQAQKAGACNVLSKEDCHIPTGACEVNPSFSISSYFDWMQGPCSSRTTESSCHNDPLMADRDTWAYMGYEPHMDSHGNDFNLYLTTQKGMHGCNWLAPDTGL